ncbi:ABC transporter permease subunit [Heyndrickxia acidicola]|uniref:ABC transporter permease subunit n=1 Tax=Heyndrickxia acidicola TaxID=209389 RepID=A0ABU6MGP7_9BACI|nr:ABC transporter permease subunit [Heyndrickxia acidicola]MED1203851.1 ABC transporter permease subunit [Heyndrickxia acidicola]
MSSALLIAMLKTTGKNIFSYAFGAAFYVILIIWIYPSVAHSDALNQVLKQMPSNYLSAFGLQGGMAGNLSGFLAGEYYGLLFIIILMIYSVMTSSQLIARFIDRGSMAYLLSTPNSRVKVAGTQAILLVFGLLMIVLFTTIAGLAGAAWMIKGGNLSVSRFVTINLMGFLLFFVITGYSFLFSCLFNDEKRALTLSGLLTIIFFALDLAAKLSDRLSWIKSLTIFTCFHPSDIARGGVNIWPSAIGLAIAGVLLYSIALYIFKKRDLPL